MHISNIFKIRFPKLRIDIQTVESPTCWRFSQSRGATTPNLPRYERCFEDLRFERFFEDLRIERSFRDLRFERSFRDFLFEIFLRDLR